MSSIKNVKMVDFDAIFNFATKKYDIQWNPCNDIFFETDVLRYRGIIEFYVSDWAEFVSFYKNTKPNASDYSKQEITEMSDKDKAYIILGAFFESENVKDNVWIRGEV